MRAAPPSTGSTRQALSMASPTAVRSPSHRKALSPRPHSVPLCHPPSSAPSSRPPRAHGEGRLGNGEAHDRVTGSTGKGTPGTLAKHAAARSRVGSVAIAAAARWRVDSDLPIAGRTLFIDRRGVNDEHYARTVERLQRLGATVSPFLEPCLDYVVAVSTNTPSAPLTPSGASSSFSRGISVRAKSLAGFVASAGTKQTSPVQFAKKNGKEVLSIPALEGILAREEKRQAHVTASSNKRSRSVSGESRSSSGLPKVPRHKVCVRHVESEFCRKGPGIPEWWNFPDCERHRYFGKDAAIEPPVPLAGKKQEPASRLVRGASKGGYCALCNVKHENAKVHADSKQHRKVVQELR